VRLRILPALEANGEMTIGALTEELELSQPNVSKQMKILVRTFHEPHRAAEASSAR